VSLLLPEKRANENRQVLCSCNFLLRDRNINFRTVLKTVVALPYTTLPRYSFSSMGYDTNYNGVVVTRNLNVHRRGNLKFSTAGPDLSSLIYPPFSIA
jgi:hypothetical protein